MDKRTPVAIFMASYALLVTNTINPNLASADQDGMGGLREWTTDQEINEDSVPDQDAKKAAKKAKKSNICIPIGEGENCW